MTTEEIRKQIKKEYSEKIDHLTNENYALQKERDEQSAEIKFLRKRVSSLENEIAKRNKRIDKVFEVLDLCGGTEYDYT